MNKTRLDWLLFILTAIVPASARAQPTTMPNTPEVTADQASVDFGFVKVGASFKKRFTLRLEGQQRFGPVSFRIGVNPPFQVSPSTGVLNPGQSLVVEVFLPVQQTPGVLGGRISIEVASPNAVVIPALTIPVSATISIPKNGDRGPPKASPPLWNSWIRSYPEGEPVTQLEPGKNYNFRFDLAAFDYSKYFQGTANAGIDIDFNRELASIPDPTTEVLVIPLLLGHGLKFIDGEQAARRLTIDLGRLRHPPDNWTKDDTLPVFADKVNALKGATDAVKATVGVTGTGKGCAAVALTIWRPAFNRPLDHIVRQVSVGPPGSEPACPSTVTSSPLKSGLLSLLALPFEQPATAALQVFETRVGNADPVSAAIFLKEGDSPEVLSWNPSRLLSEFVGSDEAQGLRRQISIARCARKEGGRCVHDYSTVATQLAAIVFSDGDPEGEGQKNADKALADLRDLSSHEKPDVFIRLVNVEGRNLFLPLGLLGLSSGDLLGRKANLVNPLPKEKTHDPDRCIASWKMVLPEHMAEVEDRFLKPVGTIPAEDLIANWKGFTDYAAPQPGATKGEGLVLLAHHGGGLLSFYPETIDSLQDVQFKHPYPAGGIAILAGCSVGQLVGDNKGLPLISKLNDLGISAVVVSPFDVQGQLGARFAMHFSYEVEKARKEGEKASLLALYQRTLLSVGDDDLASDFSPELDEFLIVGDSRVQLCPKGNPQ